MLALELGHKKVLCFLLLTLTISAVFYGSMISTGAAGRGGAAWMWSPGLAAILTQLLFRGKLGDFSWRPGKVRYLLIGYVTPWLYGLIVYITVWATGWGGFQARSIAVGEFRLPFVLSLLAQATLLFVPACLAALGEEIGWRGLLVPELARVTTFTRVALLTGAAWALWHYPAMLFADYRSQVPLWFQLPVFTISVLGMSVFTAWLRLKSGSLWPAVLWHGNHNLLIQGVFLNMTTEAGFTEYMVDDFGIGILLASLVMGYASWRKGMALTVGG